MPNPRARRERFQQDRRTLRTRTHVRRWFMQEFRAQNPLARSHDRRTCIRVYVCARSKTRRRRENNKWTLRARTRANLQQSSPSLADNWFFLIFSFNVLITVALHTSKRPDHRRRRYGAAQNKVVYAHAYVDTRSGRKCWPFARTWRLSFHAFRDLARFKGYTFFLLHEITRTASGRETK